MKKFFSLLCATLLVFSASAAPVAKKAELAKQAPAAVEQMQKVQFEKAQIANFDQLSATPAVKVNNFKPQALAKVSQATQAEPIVVIIKGNPQIVSKSGKTTIEATGNDDIIYGWVISTESLEAGKTYTYADMGAHNVYRYDNSFTVYEEATDGTFSIDAEKNITASMVTESGTYLVYTTAPSPATPTLAEKYNATGKVSTDGGANWNDAPAWVATTGADKYGPTITNLIPKGPFQNAIALNYEFVGNQIVIPTTPLTQADAENLVFVLDITNWMNGGSGAIVLDVAEDGSISLPAANANHIIGYMKAKFNTSTYEPTEMTGVYQIYANLAYSIAQPITERDTVDVTADMKIAAEPAKGIIKVSAEYEGFSYILEVVGADTVGTFSLADGTLSQQYYYGIVALDGSVKSDFTEGSVTIAKNETGLKLNGLMIGADEKAYVLDWTYTPITERDTVYVNSKILSSFYEESINGYVYQSSNTDYELIQFVTKSSEKLGTFAVADLQYGYSYLLVHKTDQTAVLFQDGEFTVSEDEEGFKLIGTLIGEDEKAYVFNLVQPVGVLQYDTDAPFDATFAWSDMSTSIEDGVIGIYATNAENLTIGLELYADPAATTIPAGTYTISDTQEAGTALKSVGIAGGYLTECWAGVRTATGISDCWFMVEGTVTLSYDEYGKLKVEVDAKNSWGQPVTALVQYTAPEVTDYYLVGWINGAAYGIEGDIDNFGDYKFVAGEDGALKVKATFNELSYVQVKDNNKQIYGPEAYVAPAAGGASAVVSATGTEKMGIDGGAEFEYTLTIAEDGTMTLSYAPTATGLNNIKANVKAAKHIANGQIVIVRDNKEYNILGTAL